MEFVGYPFHLYESIPAYKRRYVMHTADIFRSGIATFRMTYALTPRHSDVHKFHILCLTIMKSNNIST